MKKLNKFFSVLLTAALLTGMLVSTALPVSAATQAWGDFAVPSTTNRVLSTTITDASAFAQSPVDGALYASVLESAVWKLIKSTDGGRTWATSFATTGLPAVAAVAIVPSKTEADVVFLADATTMYKSMDGGKTWTTIVGVTGPAAITALDVAIFGGRYIAVIGTNGLGTMTAGVYFWDSNDVFNNLNPVGTTTFGEEVRALKMAPTFSTDRAVVAVGATLIRVNVNGGAWGASIPDNATVAAGTTVAADIAFPSDFNAITNPIYFVVAEGKGVFRMSGGTALNVAAGITLNNIDVFGAFNTGTAQILAGGSDGVVVKSTNSSASFTNVSLRSVAAATSFVLFDIGYGTNQKAYVLNASEALNVSIDGLGFFNQWSLVNETGVIANMDMAANGDIYAVTLGSSGAGDAFTVTGTALVDHATIPDEIYVMTQAAGHDFHGFFAGDAFTLTSGAAGTVTVAGEVSIAITSGTPLIGGTAPNQTVAFSAGSEVVTVTATSAGNVTWTNDGTSAATDAEVAGSDPNASMTVAGSGVAFAMDMNPITVNFAGTATPSPASLSFTGPSQGNLVAATTVGDITWTFGPGALAGDFFIGISPPSDLNDSASVTGTTASGMDLNPYAQVQITGDIANVTVTNSVGSPTNPSAGVYEFWNISDQILVTADSAANITWTQIHGTVTAAETYDPNTSMTVGGDGIAFDMDVNNSLNSLWRYFGGVWERIGTGLNVDDNVFVSPNYATDKTVMLAEMGTANAMWVSSNNGNSFSAMLSAPGSFDGTPNVIESVFVVNNTTVIVGSADGVITKNTSPFFWTETNVFGVGSAMDVTDIKQASNGDLLAVATKAGSTKVAKSTDGGATWTVITANNISYGNGAKAYVAPANDYAATGNYFVAVFDKTYRGKTEIASGGMGSATGVVTAPGIGNSDEGNGVAYISDTGSDIERARGKMDWVDNLASFGSGVAKLFVTVEADGNKLWALGVNGNIRVYTDTLAKGITGVAASDIVSTTTVFFGIPQTTNTAKVSFDTLANVTTGGGSYTVVVNTTKQTNLSTAVSAGATVSVVTIADGKGTVNLTGMAADTTYFVSVWANAPVSSFMGTASFTTVVGTPTPALNLAPAAGAVNVPVKPTFDWADVPGAVSYEVWVDTKSDFSTAVKATTPISAYAWTGANLANNTAYYWQVRAVTASGTSGWVTSVFTTELAAPPVVTVTQPAPTQTNITLTVPATETPSYIWIIVGIGALLTVLVIVLIVRTRRVV